MRREDFSNMPLRHATQYYDDPTCSICSRKILGWGRAKCDNCGASVCQRHRPLFTNYWQCPKCVSNQSSFAGQQSQQQSPFTNSSANSPASSTSAASSEIFSRMAEAEKIIRTNSTPETKQVIDLLFADIMGS